MAGERRRESFDGAAADYGRYRTPYPDEVVAGVLHCSGIGTGTRVLEIGCGTGQLSVPLAKAGAHLVAVELGANLARAARASLSPYPSARPVRQVRASAQARRLARDRPRSPCPRRNARLLRGHSAVLQEMGAQRRPLLPASSAGRCARDVSRARSPARIPVGVPPPPRDPATAYHHVLRRLAEDGLADLEPR
jgi:SAM-dependent methyltransferase